ncbi:AGAP005847-PA [Anopheles gambiae str. PEST]|uniref:Hydroxymethylglutaryl-CoA synthase n=1 Tax=Anopheles gambiae TaxID=7165 RepID=Q7Q6H2_ANOGA|nr:hydroxymethylglutaryl-CoA synthase 1 [Anopheles gambiae]EAA11950.3 AGAP005847-PA [Anopheles gambiae str. PEST]
MSSSNSTTSGQWPEDVGILGLEIVFPSQYVDQTELEAFDGVSAGKYTIGLGQQRMGFCSDREDINSLCLTAARNLLERHSIPLDRIGRLEVGTETIVDKSKSVKSVLMQLFEPEGVTDLEGIDTTNACYGGTAALLNAINWIESSSWDGRLALVVCGDIAVYAQGSARPTGGAGAVAMLIGPNAPLRFERGLRATYMKHAYDFYKPDLSSEYPVVDGKLSIQCYLSALDACYQLYRKKFAQRHPDLVAPVTLDTFDAVIFHSPYCKLVQKSLARIGLNDFVLTPADQRPALFPGFEQFANVRLEDTYFDRDVEKAFMAQYAPVFAAKTKRSLHLASQVGNMYTPSVYSCLVSLLVGSDVDELLGKRVGVFSYGSGLASSMYSIAVTTDRERLAEFKRHLNYVQPLLDRRTKVEPAEFTRLMEVREKNNHAAPYEPSGSVEVLFPGTYYLKAVDSMHRRTYERVPPEQPSS